MRLGFAAKVLGDAGQAGACDRFAPGFERLSERARSRLPKLHYSSPKTAVEERRLKRGRPVVRVPTFPPRSAHADRVNPGANAKDVALLRRPAGARLAPERQLQVAA
jgi:hypothetical protein